MTIDTNFSSYDELYKNYSLKQKEERCMLITFAWQLIKLAPS